MSGTVLILRPRPGADETAARAADFGLEPVVAPLFEIRPLDWEPPDPALVQAVAMTSANAARCAGDAMAPFLSLPCYAVGEATAEAAAAAGFSKVRAGPADGAALAAMMAADGVRRAFHPCGRDHVAFEHPETAFVRVPVYSAEETGPLSEQGRAALARGAVALLHSPRAAARFASLVDPESVVAAAISEAALRAAGPGWKRIEAADRPRDRALLELAAKLCQTGGEERPPIR